MPTFDLDDVERGISFTPLVALPFIARLSRVPAILCGTSGIGLLPLSFILLAFSSETLIGVSMLAMSFLATYLGFHFFHLAKDQNAS